MTANTDTAGAEIAEFADELATIADGAMAGETSVAERTAGNAGGINLDMVMRIPVVMKIVIGGASLPVSALSRMRRGDIVNLDRRAGEPADIVVNGRTLARGKIIVTDEATGQLGISLTEIIGTRTSDA